MISNLSSTPPAVHSDGTISAQVLEIRSLSTGGALLRLFLPIAYDAGGGLGRFMLARCTEDRLEARAEEWSIYARRALFTTALPTARPTTSPEESGSEWEFLIPDSRDAGHRWLRGRKVGTTINLLGLFGQPFELANYTRALLILTNPNTLPIVLPTIHSMLDRGGRVTLLIVGETEIVTPLLPLIPIAVEVRILPTDNWLTHLAEPVRWADQIFAALANQAYSPLAHHVRTLRFQLDPEFVHVHVASDLLCGTGACLACVVATRDGGYTRTCIHGPILPLAAIA